VFGTGSSSFISGNLHCRQVQRNINQSSKVFISCWRLPFPDIVSSVTATKQIDSVSTSLVAKFRTLEQSGTTSVQYGTD
jgi:hypothetical protein